MFRRWLLPVVIAALLLTAAARAADDAPAPDQPPAPPKPAAFPTQTIDVQIGGGGVIGAVLRQNLSDKFSAGVGVMLRPTIVSKEGGGADTSIGLFFPLECTFWAPGKGGDKGPNRHGFGLMAGIGTGQFGEVGVGVYYDYQRFTRTNHVYSASIGAAYFVPTNLPDNVQAATSAAIFWRFAWGWGI